MSLSFPGKPASISRGRHMTHDSGKFIADVEASLLKKNSRVSKQARRLYGTLRALADGKTGELRIGGRWLKATVFDRAAEMCKRVRLSAMRELIAEGYVAMERPLIRREIAGRSRAVLGACQYRVLKVPKPKTCQNSKDSSRVHLLGCISCTVQEMHQQVLSTTPPEVLDSVLGSGGKNSVREHTSSSSKAPAKTPNPDDDDVCIPVPENHKLIVNPNSQPDPAAKAGQNQNHLVRIDRQIEKIKTRAQALLEGRGLDSIFVRQAILLIDSRAIEIPVSANYYLTAFEALGLEDLHKIEEESKWIRANGARAEKNIAFVHDIIETADRTCQSAADVLRARVESDIPQKEKT